MRFGGDAAPRRRASAAFVYVTIALDALAFGIVIPVEPDLVMKIGHVPPSAASFWLGALLAAFSTMQFLASPVLGGLSDRFGRRPVLLMSLAVLGISAAVTPFVPGLFWLLAVRMIAGATSGNSAAAQAYISDVTPAGERAQRFGAVGALYGLGFVLGPAVGGTLGAMSLALPFLASAALAACNVVYGLVALPESLSPELRRPLEWRRANPLGTLAAVFVGGDLVRLGVAWCCSWFALGAQQSSFILANEMRFHWNTWQNGLVLALAGAASAATQGVLVRSIVARLGPQRTAVLGLGFCAIGYGCYSFAVTSSIMFCGVLILALGALGNPAI